MPRHIFEFDDGDTDGPMVSYRTDFMVVPTDPGKPCYGPLCLMHVRTFADGVDNPKMKRFINEQLKLEEGHYTLRSFENVDNDFSRFS